MAPLAPGRGEGPGVRGEDPWELLWWATDEGCFCATDEHGFSRMNRRVPVFSPFDFLVSAFYGRDAIAPLTPDPSPPFRGRGEDFVFQFSVWGWGALRLCV